MRVDVSEISSPARVTTVCKQYGLIPRQAMDIKNGFGFDLAADRKKAWDSILRDEPTLAIGSPPCTFSPHCKSLTNTCIEMTQLGWQSFKRALNRQEDMLDVALIFTNINDKLGVIFYMNIHGYTS